MDPRDRFRPPLDGAACAACGKTVPAGRIWIPDPRGDAAGWHGDLVGWLDTLDGSGWRGSVVYQ